ncbi:MAG: glycoside hydrolase family 95-like protein, partial [Muribaculaceae bacterium]
VSPSGVAMAEEDIFSFDATEASVAGMCEMLMQSYDGFIEFLPALPKQWNKGEVKGLCAEGGLVIDMKWAEGKMLTATITATVDCTFAVKGIAKKFTLKKGESTIIDF